MEWEEIIKCFSDKNGMRVLEIGKAWGGIAPHLKEKNWQITSTSSLDMGQPLTGCDIIWVPALMNQVPKEQAFFVLDYLLAYAKEHILILLDGGHGPFPLILADFSAYDLSFFELSAGRLLLKIYPVGEKKISSLKPSSTIFERPLLRLLFVMPNRDLTGGLKMLFEQMKALKEKGHYIGILLRGDFLSPIPPWLEDFEPDVSKIIPQGEPYKKHLEGFDLIVAGFYNQLEELAQDGAPVFYWEQGHQGLFGDLKQSRHEEKIRSYYRHQFGQGAYLGANSEYVRNIVKGRFQLDSYLLPCFIDTERWQPALNKEKGGLPTVLLVGTPALSFKGFQKSLAVLSRCWQQGNRFQVIWICQHQPILPALPFAIDFQIGAPQWELPKIYQKTDVLLSCSLYEGFALPPLEAMAAGVAVVATQSGGIGQFAVHQVNALIAFSNTVPELCQLLDLALNDEPKRESLIKQGLLTAQDYGKSEAVDQLEGILHHVRADFLAKG